MTNQELQELIGSWFPNPAYEKESAAAVEIEAEEDTEEKSAPDEIIDPSLLEFSEEGSQFLNITVLPEQLHSLMSLLKSNKETHFDYLFCLTGVDWGAALGVVYHLESTTHRHSIVVKTQTPDRENPTLDSVCDIWMTAEFHEREAYDFFGITFNNHPNLKRLFLTDEWEGFPLRKDYVDEINMVIK
ncbi:MAG: NADH-quinone oxidoreductase subunit C [Maribacter sp.]|nr:NADH-quinone oxidoreductase subunit C [Maribacter sp.]MBT8302572.1 NADH-quinone oxidoreductase subunit C [Maribacter sp.]NND78620.1 NADH-quinone oxidoreductase subunit C [Maribacter sp.]